MTQRYMTFKIRNTFKERYEYYVTGRGVFPFDMLRYDSAWPASGEDAVKLSTDRRFQDERAMTRSIRLQSFTPPTIDRWSSFGWSVGVEDLTRAHRQPLPA